MLEINIQILAPNISFKNHILVEHLRKHFPDLVIRTISYKIRNYPDLIEYSVNREDNPSKRDIVNDCFIDVQPPTVQEP